MTQRALPKRTLVIALAGIGDLMFFLPALHALQRLRMHGELDVLVFANGTAALIRSARLADRVFEVSGASTRMLSARIATLKALRALRLTGYDLALWPFSFTTLKKRVMSRMIGAKRFIMHEPLTAWARLPLGLPEEWLPYTPGRHIVDINLDIARAVGLATEQPHGTLLPLALDDLQAGADLARIWRSDKADTRLIAIHPGGNTAWNPDRQWPIERFARLARRVCDEMDASIVWLGTPTERPLLERGRELSERGRIETGLSLTHLASALSHADAVVGNDSAIVHLAAAMGTRTAVIHGPTDHTLTGPWRPGSLAIRAVLPCSPCFDSGFSTQCPHRMCLVRLDEAAHVLA